jgi:hypothetical protein
MQRIDGILDFRRNVAPDMEKLMRKYLTAEMFLFIPKNFLAYRFVI